MVNSSVSKQWLLERYAMKAARVQGAGAVFARISRRFGLLGQKGAVSDDIGRVDDVAEAGADAAM